MFYSWCSNPSTFLMYQVLISKSSYPISIFFQIFHFELTHACSFIFQLVKFLLIFYSSIKYLLIGLIIFRIRSKLYNGHRAYIRFFHQLKHNWHNIETSSNTFNSFQLYFIFNHLEKYINLKSINSMILYLIIGFRTFDSIKF